MRIHGLLHAVVAGAALVLLTAALPTAALSQEPVTIAFDPGSGRTDIVTGNTLPDYTMAQRGSIRFHHHRLDTADSYFEFYHDGVQRAEISSLRRMEKVQPRFAIWRLRYRSGSKNTPRIHHLAVSFVPVDAVSGETARCVYVLLNDLSLIDWGE